MLGSTANGELPKRFSLVAAIVAAVAASSCCIGPVVLAALGLGGAGAFATLGAWRPVMLAVTACLLGVGFYLAYRKPKASADGCGCGLRTSRVSRMGLWIATVSTVVLAASPSVLAKLSLGATPVARAGPVEAAILRVPGVDCDACVGPIRKALAAQAGFDDVTLDVATKSVTVVYEPGPERPGVYIKAIEELGYEASLDEVRK